MLERLKDIFKGLESAHGVTKKTDEIRHDGKNEVRSKTIREPVTDELWEKHLKGEEPGLGIIPINEQNKCKWGAIDIDTYPFDHLKLIKKIRENKFPLIVLITSIVWIIVTFMTQPEESDVLEKFYKKTQPGGPGWNKIVNEANTNGNNIVDTKEGWSVPSGILAMLVGCVLIYSVMFTTGNFIYGNYTNAFVLLGVSVISGLILIKLWKKIKATIL